MPSAAGQKSDDGVAETELIVEVVTFVEELNDPVDVPGPALELTNLAPYTLLLLPATPRVLFM